MKLTSVQKHVIEWMKRQGGEGIILTGYKKTFAHVHKGVPVMCCSTNVTHGLETKKLIEFTDRWAWKGAAVWRLCNPNKGSSGVLPPVV